MVLINYTTPYDYNDIGFSLTIQLTNITIMGRFSYTTSYEYNNYGPL